MNHVSTKGRQICRPFLFVRKNEYLTFVMYLKSFNMINGKRKHPLTSKNQVFYLKKAEFQKLFLVKT